MDALGREIIEKTERIKDLRRLAEQFDQDARRARDEANELERLLDLKRRAHG